MPCYQLRPTISDTEKYNIVKVNECTLNSIRQLSQLPFISTLFLTPYTSIFVKFYCIIYKIKMLKLII